MKYRHFIPALLFAGLLTAVAATPAKEVPESSHDSAVARNLLIFNALVRQLENTYVDSIRPDEAFEASIGAMLNTVDPYTEYYTSNEKDRFMQMTTGTYGGIGAFVMNRNGSTYISEPIEGTPSFKAGLKAGDKLVRIDTVDVSGSQSDVTTKLLKGEPGTTVVVTVERPYVADSILTFEIVRERVQEKSVPYYGVVGGNTGYIKLNSFMELSAGEVGKALEEFKGNPAVENIVLDLRGNGGGLVESAVEILGYFLPKGTEVVVTKGRDESSKRTYKTMHSPVMPDIPLAVLIDEGSASASEITAGALQDLDRAVLVGKRSFGKGLVQSTYSLPFDGLLKVTTAKYYIPSGRLIQALDYSHRNPDGSVARTPDSLTNEYKTRHGRIVRDGGGLLPDTVTPSKDYSRLLYNLIMANQIFDYANKYAATHPSIPTPSEFTVTDEIYDDFVAFVDTAKVKSDKIGKMIVSDLKDAARTEGFLTPELEEALKALEPMVEPELRDVLYSKRDEISEYLGREIVVRYYATRGQEEYDRRFDRELEVARAILGDRKLYNSILNIGGK